MFSQNLTEESSLNVLFPAIFAPDMLETATSTSPPAILVVDDAPEVATYVRCVLRLAGYVVHSAQRAEEAMEILRSDRQIDLLLTDVIMPDMDGLDLAVSAVVARRGLPVLLMCAWPSNPIVRKKETCAFPMLQKPFTPKQLLAGVESTLRTGLKSQAGSYPGIHSRTSAGA